MATELEIQERLVRQLLAQLQRTQSVFDPLSADYTTLQTGIDQTITRLNELRAEQGLNPVNPGNIASPLTRPNP